MQKLLKYQQGETALSSTNVFERAVEAPFTVK